MDWLFTISLSIVLLIAGFMLFFFMPKPKVFFDTYTNTIEIFKQNHELVCNEVLGNKNLGETNLDDSSRDPVVPIYGFGEIKTYEYPIVYNCLRCVPYVRFAGIITIKPKFQQAREYGLDVIANHTMRYFYTLKESAGHKSGIWIDGEKRFFTEKEWICGDMSREHSLFNKDKERSSVVLFIDIDRHETIHEGRSPNKDIKKDEILKMFEGEYMPGQRTELTIDDSDDDISAE